MKYTVDDLNDATLFQKRLELRYDEIASYVIENLQQMPLLKKSFIGFCIILFFVYGFFLGSCIGSIKWHTLLLYTILGFIVLPLLIIVLHEIIHIIPLLALGIKNIRASIELKQYMVLVTTHKKVLSDKYYYFIAILPFVTISTAIIILMFHTPLIWQYTLSALLFVHTTCCIGDLILIASCKKLGRNIYTWDDFDQRISYYYQKIS
ncbi:MAG: DUF3267 domain-containing protein [Bacteroidales bacterium]|nr:DUF3267 domain-containing protein [Bacteroidales bacterium]